MQEVPFYDPSLYSSKRIHATSRDGMTYLKLKLKFVSSFFGHSSFHDTSNLISFFSSFPLFSLKISFHKLYTLLPPFSPIPPQPSLFPVTLSSLPFLFFSSFHFFSTPLFFSFPSPFSLHPIPLSLSLSLSLSPSLSHPYPYPYPYPVLAY